MNAGRDGEHANEVGSVIDNAVGDAAFTATGTPSTTTAFPAGVGAKLFPTTVNVPPGRSGSGRTETMTGAPGFGVSVTLIRAAADCASTVAVTVTDPTAMPITRPVEFTDAISGADDCQTMDGFGIGLPLESRTVAMSCMEPPGSAIVAVSREKVIDPALGFRTTTCASPVTAPAAARTVPMPACSPVTAPVAVTLTTDGVSDDQTGARPVTVSPCASVRIAVA